MTRVENYLDALVNMEECPDYPKVTRTRVENYLDAICKNAGRRKVMPTAGSEYRGKIIQYVGESDGTYTKGYFYVCNEEGSGTYSWSQINVQPGGGGGGTPIEAGKGIDIEEYAPLSITVEVSGQLPPDFEGDLPFTLNLPGIKAGTNMWDLFEEGKIEFEQLFYWDGTYELTVSGLDSEVAEVAELTLGAYVLQFNGAGTTSGTVTATRNELGYPETYTANITVTATTGEPSNKISADIYELGWDFYDCVDSLDFNESADGEDALAALGGHDGFVEFVKAVKNDAKFIMALDSQNIDFETVTSSATFLSIQHQFVGSMIAARYDIYFDEGDDESIEITKYRTVNLFNDEFDGLVPASGSSASGKFLRADGTWAEFNGLRLDNTTAYTPTGNYNPATKKYVDDAVGNIDTLLANLISGGGAE